MLVPILTYYYIQNKMNNITKYKGQRIKDKFKGGVEKVYDLCDYINKKAMTWYALNIEYSANEVKLIKRVQQTMEEMKKILDEINKNEIHYDNFELGYNVYMHTCEECNGKVYVTRFKVTELGHNYNVYKCIDCGKEFEDDHPNTYEHYKEYFKFVYQKAAISLSSNIVSEEDKVIMREDLKNIHIMEEKIYKDEEALLNYHKLLKEYIVTTIEENGETYKELIKYKHHFDRNIGVA